MKSILGVRSLTHLEQAVIEQRLGTNPGCICDADGRGNVGSRQDIYANGHVLGVGGYSCMWRHCFREVAW
jgi:hypothetical protein